MATCAKLTKTSRSASKMLRSSTRGMYEAFNMNERHVSCILFSNRKNGACTDTVDDLSYKLPLLSLNGLLEFTPSSTLLRQKICRELQRPHIDVNM